MTTPRSVSIVEIKTRLRHQLRQLLMTVGNHQYAGRIRRLWLNDPELREKAFRELEDHLAMSEATFENSRRRAPATLRGFEDLHWLHSSNPANHGLSRLRLDESAYLYRVVRSLENPRVAELGRYKGGTTFMLAAAGARVLSIDNDALEAMQADVEAGLPDAEERATGGRFVEGESGFRRSLTEALDAYGLTDAVELVTGDTSQHETDPGDQFDLILFDASNTYEGMSAEFEKWWPRLKVGGRCVFRDGSGRWMPEIVKFSNALSAGTIQPEGEFRAEEEPDPPGSFSVFVKRSRA